MRSATEREEFSRRLRLLLRERGYAEGGAAAIAREFNDRFPDAAVTQQAVRKWLVGEAIPSQAKIKALAAWLECSSEWLRFGDSAKPHLQQPMSPVYKVELSDQELVRRFRKLGDRQRAAVAEILISLGAKAK